VTKVLNDNFVSAEKQESQQQMANALHGSYCIVLYIDIYIALLTV